MGLITGILGLPLAPLRGTVGIAEQIRQQAEEEFYDPARIRAQLEQIAQQRAEGELTDDEATAWEDELVERLMVGATRHAGRDSGRWPPRRPRHRSSRPRRAPVRKAPAKKTSAEAAPQKRTTAAALGAASSARHKRPSPRSPRRRPSSCSSSPAGRPRA